jgi:hypothetical protein
MSIKDWEQKVLAESGAAERVAEIEDEMRLAAGRIDPCDQADVHEGTDNPFASASEEILRMAADGSLRSDIDSQLDDPDLAVD